MKDKKYVKVCEYCGEEFWTNIQNQRYCSRYHGNKAKQERLKNKPTENTTTVPQIEVLGYQKFIGKDIPVIEGGFGEGKRCLTDKTIAEIHNQPTIEIRRRINDNLKRFKVNIDYIDLKFTMDDSHSKQILKSLDYTDVAIRNAQHIYLLSERGYAKLIKIMDTDLAWEIHDELIDRYFSMRKEIKEQQLKLTRKQELAILILEGGTKALEASKELSNIESEEEAKKIRIESEREKRILNLEHEKRIREQKASRNHKISVTQVVELLGINGLTTGILHEWFANIKNLGTYEKPYGEKKRLFQPNEEFIKWVALEGYAFTGVTIKRNKISVAYSTELVERIQKQHINSLINYVKLKTESKETEEYKPIKDNYLWAEVIKFIKEDKKPSIFTLLKEAYKIVPYKDNFYIIFENNFSFARTRLSSEETIKYIAEMISKVYKYDFEVHILLREEFEKISV